MTRIFLLSLALLMLLPLTGEAYAQPVGETNDEIQVLIDVSGSMKQNDPANLRIEASKLLINLLPERANVSIWSFAEKTTLLSHTDAVDAAWKGKAMAAMTNIHSNGLYTHIEEAIQTVLKAGFKGSGKKSLLLLTDGMVDISKDIMQSADSRERVLSEWTPRLQQQHIQVQSIALSAEADKELLETLARSTDGWMETAESAEQLQRMFLKMMQKTAPKDSVPLQGNRFHVDSGVKEFSVLAFKKPHAAATQLLTADSKKLGKAQASDSLAWLEAGQYDLVTVRQPQPGDWQLLADTDPDNQVMIVTDLQLLVEELPHFVEEKQPLTIKAHFTDKGQLISRADFLAMIDLGIEMDGHALASIKADAGNGGYFTYRLEPPAAGKHALRILADGKTFKREVLKEIEVKASMLSVEKLVDVEKRQVTINITPDPQAITSEGLVISAQVNTAGKPPNPQLLINHQGVWQLLLNDLPPGSQTVVNFSVMAKDKLGKPITPELLPVSISDSDFVVAAAEPEPVHEETPAHPAEADHEPDASTETEQAHDAESSSGEDVSWPKVIGLVLAANLLLGGLGFLIYRAVKQANHNKQQKLLERLA